MISSLNVSQTGLNAAKIAVENVSNNIANEGTAGYKKRVVQLSEIEQTQNSITGRGVSAEDVYRITSYYLYDNLIDESTKSGYYDKLSSIIGNAEAVFGETEESGFSSDLDRYFQAIENLRSDPYSQVYKSNLKTQGNILVESMQNLYSSLEKQENFEKTELKTNVETVNSILKEIGSLNERMGQYNVVSNDMLDKRDQLEQELSKYADIEISRDTEDYELKIGGVTAVRYNTNVRNIELKEENTPQIDKFKKDDGITSSIEVPSGTFNNDDTITFTLNNEFDISVKFGENITDLNGNAVDLDGDSTNGVSNTVSASNYLRALVYKINTNVNTKDLVTAYNGDYSIDPNTGDKITNNSIDNYLRIESNKNGVANSFDAKVSIVEQTGTNITARDTIFKDEYQSTESVSKVYLSIYDGELSLSGGSLKAQIDNLSSTSSNNKIQTYKDKLDSLAKALSDISDKYIETSLDNYIYGENASENAMLGQVKDLGLFSGANVKTLKFNQNNVNDLTQKDLNYLATLQWKTDVSFDGYAQPINDTEKAKIQTSNSLSGFFQELRVTIASDKENNDFLLETQTNIRQTLESSYNQLVKVDKDEEMLNLIKFQAAYTANAKIITTVDEMLDILLGIKR